MFSLTRKRFSSLFAFLLSILISASIAICHCPPGFSPKHHQHAQANQGEGHCHGEKSHHQDSDDSKHGHSDRACLCSNDSTNGYLNQAEKAPVKTDFLAAVLNQFQRGFVIDRPSFKLFRSTHSPPRESQRLYITHLTLLI